MEAGDRGTGTIDREILNFISLGVQAEAKLLGKIVRILYLMGCKKKNLAHVLEEAKIYPFPGPR